MVNEGFLAGLLPTPLIPSYLLHLRLHFLALVVSQGHDRLYDVAAHITVQKKAINVRHLQKMLSYSSPVRDNKSL